MADADEDTIHPSTSVAGGDGDGDLDDETQDFRFLSSLPHSSPIPSLPRRGEKDFEPHGTASQSATLSASRAAMHQALSYPRLHNPKFNVTATYNPQTGLCVVDRPRGQHFRKMGKEDYRAHMHLLPEEALFLLERGGLDLRWPGGKGEEAGDVEGGGEDGDGGKESKRGDGKGQEKSKRRDGGKGRRKGKGRDGEGGEESKKKDGGEGGRENKARDGKVREEVNGKDEKGAEESRVRDGEGEEWQGLPMSLQSAYAVLIGSMGLSVERYVVYAGLKRLGYVLVRGEGWYSESDEKSMAKKSPQKPVSLIQWLVSLLTPKPQWSEIPLVGIGFYRDYRSIYRRLSLIPFHDPTHPHPPSSTPLPSALPDPSPSAISPDPPLRIAYHVWKPSTHYTKNQHPPPDFRLVVLDARTSSLPSLTQLSDLMDIVPLDSPPDRLRGGKGNRGGGVGAVGAVGAVSKLYQRLSGGQGSGGGSAGQLYARLKHGHKSVVLAVVDTGVVSYLRTSDAGFGRERVWERMGRGGRGKGRGRGGRGGGGRGRGTGRG